MTHAEAASKAADRTVQETADLAVCAMARAMAGDEVAGAALPCALLAALLARALHNPGLVVLGSLGLPLAPRAWEDGSGFRLSLTRDESVALPFAEARLGLEDTFGYVLRGRFAIWIAPAQLDALGSANISAVGPWAAPKVALVGSRGLPDDAWHLPEMRYYVPRHEPRAFPARVDFVSAPGFTPERVREGGGRGLPGRVVTSLGVFRYGPDGLRAESLHPGVSPETVARATGFPVRGLADAPETPVVTVEERAWLERLDPLAIRRLEFLPPREGRNLAVAIAEEERKEERAWTSADAARPGWPSRGSEPSSRR